MNKALLVSAFCVAFLSIPNVSHALIVEMGSFTRDTDTGLDWLDFTETANRSYNDIAGNLGPGGEFEGWRHASIDEIAVLLINGFGLTDGGYQYQSRYYDEVDYFLDVFGAVIDEPDYNEVVLLNDRFSLDGYNTLVYSKRESRPIYQLEVDINGQPAHETGFFSTVVWQDPEIPGQPPYFEGATDPFAGGVLDDYASPDENLTHFLVRNTPVVPEPATMLLFAGGLTGAYLRRRYKRSS